MNVRHGMREFLFLIIIYFETSIIILSNERTTENLDGISFHQPKTYFLQSLLFKLWANIKHRKK